jgi:hypothetical protein
MEKPKRHYCRFRHRGTNTAKKKYLNAMKKYGGVEV